MELNNLLISGNLIEEIQSILDEKDISKNVRYKDENEVTEDDLEWADAYVGFKPKASLDFSKVKWVHSTGAGVDRFLDERNWDPGVLLTRTIASFGQKIAEYSLSYILRHLQKHNQFIQYQAKKEWNPVTPGILSEQRVVVFGTGEIGQVVANKLSSLGVSVTGVSASGSGKPYFDQVIAQNKDLTSYLSNANWVISTLPLTSDTNGMLDEKIFTKLNSAGFINVGRGKTVNTNHLLNALDDEKIHTAVLDVFEEEPLPQSSPFWEHDNVIITPHISAETTPAEAVACFLETLEKVEASENFKNQVDIDRGY
ncbi:D-2-hydroxyacid dehydrogenase [Aquibacillus albus]|uniref:Phosphoglycerate dehydrogenase-like enzyme n=1 Tax=Aquibacillus albus TaxID=1168171 RepID=A0ABS2N611_9BACI|nr:D-2-hydroxyacid dehydrogenase [Aquibacillus albus]MBM7573330.1 phosphoglycerate dehydrogenase-like enzyme [Aquibacillus albus]